MWRILVFTHSVLHRVLIGHAHSSKFMEWQNLGIATLKHAICATNVFLKLPENQTTTNFIYLPSSNFVTISHINYWDQVNSWKNLWKFWNGPLCRNKSGSSPPTQCCSILAEIYICTFHIKACLTQHNKSTKLI